MKVLFIGGTGIISSACTPLAVERGMEVTLLNRGKSTRSVPDGVDVVQADIRDPAAVRRALAGRRFDVIVDWIAFTPQHIETALSLFRGRTRQFVFISSASAYQTPPRSLPVRESTPLENPFWQYSRDKIACERRLMDAWRKEDFPVTIVRPSHTYDETCLPISGGYTCVDRMRLGKPVVVHGDGTSIWTLTHHRDFAKGFVGLLGREDAIGHAFHITSDELLTWNGIYEAIGRAAGVTPQLFHVPSTTIASHDSDWGAGLLGDKAHSMIFDNTKIKTFVPEFSADRSFEEGAKEIMAWFDADLSRHVIDPVRDRRMDEIIAAYG